LGKNNAYKALVSESEGRIPTGEQRFNGKIILNNITIL
jgi:hypothetical protein